MSARAPFRAKVPWASSFLRYSRSRYSLCMRQGMRVPSAFQAMRSFSCGRSPRMY